MKIPLIAISLFVLPLLSSAQEGVPPKFDISWSRRDDGYQLSVENISESDVLIVDSRDNSISGLVKYYNKNSPSDERLRASMGATAMFTPTVLRPLPKRTKNSNVSQDPQARIWRTQMIFAPIDDQLKNDKNFVLKEVICRISYISISDIRNIKNIEDMDKVTKIWEGVAHEGSKREINKEDGKKSPNR